MIFVSESFISCGSSGAVTKIMAISGGSSPPPPSALYCQYKTGGNFKFSLCYANWAYLPCGSLQPDDCPLPFIVLSKCPGVNVTLLGIAGWSTGSFGVIFSSWWSCWLSCCSGGGVVFSNCAGISLSPLLLLFLESTDSPSLM